ncbi:hypothetical protein J6590_038068 [Homalodisca vitripennis]|nr:hypothetical protein J6590_038068 [Homalodisca vitripennis]
MTNIVASPSLSSPRHGGAARHQFVPDVLLRGAASSGDQTAPRQPDLVTVYSPGETLQRNYGTDSSPPDNERYQNYDDANTEA